MNEPYDAEEPVGIELTVTDDSLVVALADGRTVSAPIVWYPRLCYGSPGERKVWEWIGSGTGIHWPLLDEDISVAGILAGRPSMESRASLQRWLQRRQAAESPKAITPDDAGDAPRT